MKIATIIGARPQFIKAAAVSRAIAAHNRLTPHSSRLTEVIIHTGQHYDNGMSAVFFEELEIPDPKYNLAIGSGSHGQQTGQMLAKIEDVLIVEAPDWVLVYGDTNSTLAGALAAAKLHFKIAHVEAGLRSFNRLMPEEINRVLTDHISTYLFCPSETAVENLRREGLAPHSSPLTPHSSRVFMIGDVMSDALRFALSRAASRANIMNHLELQEKTYLLATIHRPENTEDIKRLQNILAALENTKQKIIFPVHPRTKKTLQNLYYRPPGHVKLIEPVGYFEMIALEQSSRMILTDSGGMQKEAYWLKVPCITLRDETEWVETVETGWNVLTGADPQKIVAAVNTFTPPLEHPPLFGDGNSAGKVVEALGVKS